MNYGLMRPFVSNYKVFTMSRAIYGLLWIALQFAVSAGAEEVSREQIKGIDEQVQEIKKDVLSISSELKLLEEKLLYPSNTQISLFVSLSGKEKFRLDSVEVMLDGKAVATHIYSFKELEALQAGGMQRIYTGNVQTGEHLLKVGSIGKSADGKEQRQTGEYRFKKGIGPGLVEINLAGTGEQGNGIEFKNW
jgi:archaellum component FlaG (FlaF/FlaG flagellin family)